MEPRGEIELTILEIKNTSPKELQLIQRMERTSHCLVFIFSSTVQRIVRSFDKKKKIPLPT